MTPHYVSFVVMMALGVAHPGGSRAQGHAPHGETVAATARESADPGATGSSTPAGQTSVQASSTGSLADFDTRFEDATLRIDYYHTGDATSEIITLDRLYRQGIWSGSRIHLIDPFDNGRYYAELHDLETGATVFSRGFDSYFGEYRTTRAASNGIQRTYHESVLVPFPRNSVRFVLKARDDHNRLRPIFETVIDPADYTIVTAPPPGEVEVIPVVDNGDPHGKVDIAILAEGYTRKERDKFEKDLARFADVFFSQEPYASLKSAFNLRGLFVASRESGCDEPRRGIYRDTALGVTFDSLGLERYLLTEDNRAMRDVAAHAPYDALYIMVNSDRYGGGGIYNLYCTFTADNQWYDYLYVHEFGHAFGGLADEYYSSNVAYDTFYPPGVEPTEPNITALLDPAHVKWAALLTPGIEIPTPWEKDGFDALAAKYRAQREKMTAKLKELEEKGAPRHQIDRLKRRMERASRKNAREMQRYLRKSRYWGQVGAFEGAGYASTGLYRPMVDCVMFTRGLKPFCRVCDQALRAVIEHYLE